jgi:hypothetical protein
VATHSFADGADIERLLARTCKPIWWADRAYEFVVLESRRGPGITQELESGEPAQCNVIGVSASDVEQGAPWGAPSWRGGLAAIGTLSIA